MPEVHSTVSVIRTVEDLDVYRRAYSLSLTIHKLSLDMPKIEQFAIADQIRRSSKSICSNLAEGFAKQRHSAPEFKRFIMIAIGSSDEMKVWLDYCRDLGYFSPEQTHRFKAEYTEIARMLLGLSKSWTKQK